MINAIKTTITIIPTQQITATWVLQQHIRPQARVSGVGLN